MDFLILKQYSLGYDLWNRIIQENSSSMHCVKSLLFDLRPIKNLSQNWYPKNTSVHTGHCTPDKAITLVHQYMLTDLPIMLNSNNSDNSEAMTKYRA